MPFFTLKYVNNEILGKHNSKLPQIRREEKTNIRVVKYIPKINVCPHGCYNTERLRY